MQIGSEYAKASYHTDPLAEKASIQPWVSHDCYHILGHRVLVRSTSWDFAAQVRQWLRSFPLTSGDTLSPDVTLSFLVAPPSKSRSIRPFHFVYHNYDQVGRTTSYWQLFRYLEIQLNFFLAEQVQDRYLVHAGAVARDRSGIILAGPSGSGKSSLTMGLLQKGYQYLSDELAVVDASTCELHAFPKPLSIKDISIFPDLADRDDFWLGPQDGERRHEEPVWYAHAEDIRPDSIGGPVPICYIIFPSYDSAAPPQLQPMSPDEVVQQLISNSVNFTRFGKYGLHLLAALVEDVESFSLIVNDLGKTTNLINELTGH